jgi:hypothetical protein
MIVGVSVGIGTVVGTGVDWQAVKSRLVIKIFPKIVLFK